MNYQPTPPWNIDTMLGYAPKAELRRRRIATTNRSFTTEDDEERDDNRKLLIGTPELRIILVTLPGFVILIHVVLIAFIVFQRAIPISHTPELTKLLKTVSAVMAANDVRAWVSPGAELMPVNLENRELRFTRYHRWLQLGAMKGSELLVADALSQNDSLSSVETHGGLRIFFNTNWNESAPENYREPYIELIYYRDDDPLLASHCCACASRVPPIDACTKKICSCRTCVIYKPALEPLAPIRIDNVGVLGPFQIATLLLDVNASDIHPFVKNLL